MTQEEKDALAAEKAKEQEALEHSQEKKDDIDYKAIAEAERQKATDAQKAAAELAFKLREAKRKKSEDEDESEEDAEEDEKPITARDLQTVLARERELHQKTLQEDRALKIARENTSSEDEAQAAFLIWKNRVSPTGDVEADVHFAIGGLNSKRVLAQNAELKRALRGRDNANTDTTEAHIDPPTGSAPKLSAMDASAYQRAGFVYDAKDRVYKKKLPTGKYLIKDPKTKATRIV